MTTGAAKTIREIQRQQIESSLATLSHLETLTTLMRVVFTLHPDAQPLFGSFLLEEHSKYQRQREALERLLAMPDPPSGQVH
jgi:hypothetical protein